MKKLIPLTLAIILLLSLAACGSGGDKTVTDPSVNTHPSGTTFTFSPDGIDITIGAAAEPVLAALGEARGQEEQESCALDAVDVRYDYVSFYLTVTYPEGQGEAYVTGILLRNDDYATAEGVRIGSPRAQVQSLAGGNYREANNFYIYTGGRSELKISFDADDEVNQIMYEYIFDA